MSIFLKVKAVSLMAEARIIRREESKAAGDIKVDLADHRRTVVRKAARSTHLARAYLRGTPYSSVERKCHEKPDWPAVEKMVRRYGPPRHNVSFGDWQSAS